MSKPFDLGALLGRLLESDDDDGDGDDGDGDDGDGGDASANGNIEYIGEADGVDGVDVIDGEADAGDDGDEDGEDGGDIDNDDNDNDEVDNDTDGGINAEPISPIINQDNVLLYGNDMVMFNDITATMVTMAGRIRQFEYNEADLVQILEPIGAINCIVCNFGCKPPNYGVVAVNPTASLRGRKRKEKQKRIRKIQGTGKCFNSQITFIMQSTQAGKQYKFKIFRNGKIQLPGAKPALYSDIYDKLIFIVGEINNRVKAPPEQLAFVSRFAPSMKNYKFSVKKASSELIDLYHLNELLLNEWIDDVQIPLANNYDDQFIPPADITITYMAVDYTRQDTRLSVQFRTPLPNRPNKTLRINIFMKGVIKILGSLHDTVTVSVIRHLHDLFAKNPQLMIGETDDENDDNIEFVIITSDLFNRAVRELYPPSLCDLFISDELARAIDEELETWVG
jgi:hypothetical protein